VKFESGFGRAGMSGNKGVVVVTRAETVLQQSYCSHEGLYGE